MKKNGTKDKFQSILSIKNIYKRTNIPFLRYFSTPFSIVKLRKFVMGISPIKILDVGCGNSSASKFKDFFPEMQYWGIDRVNYNNREEDFSAMYRFVQADLENDSLLQIPDDYFDLVIMTHVVEHLRNYKGVLLKICDKVKTGGYLYIETPSEASVNFPSRLGILNFFDDPTHIIPVPLDEIKKIIESKSMEIMCNGQRKSPRELLFFPLVILTDLVHYKTVRGGSLWNLYGFATYALSKKHQLS